MEGNALDKTGRSLLTPRRMKIILWGLLILVSMLGLFVFISYKTFQYYYAKAPDPIVIYTIDKTIDASVPEWIPVDIDIEETIPAKLSKVLEVMIPIRKDVDIWIDDDFTVPLDAIFSVPLDQDVHIDTEIPVNLEIPLEGTNVQTTLLGFDITLPLYGTIPVQTIIPIKRPVHVKTQADIHIQDSVNVRVKKQLTFPLDLKLKVKIPIEDIFDVRFAKKINLKARMPDKIPVDIHLEVTLPKGGILKKD